MTWKTRGAGWTQAALAVLALGWPAGLAAQEVPAAMTPDPEMAGDAAVAVVQELFDAMRASDTTAMRALFAAEVGSFPSSGLNRQATPAISYASLDQWLGGVGGQEPGSLDERITVRDVIVDDNLVTVITPYAFYYQGNFSHCGVDVFLIARQGEEWKIAGLADTRRRGGCEGWLDE